MLESKKIIDRIRVLDELPKSTGFQQNVGSNSKISRKVLDGEDVALKKIKTDDMGINEKQARLFLREVIDQILANHPCILPLRAFNLFHYSNKMELFICRACLATKFCDGGMLSSFIKKMKRNHYLPKKYIRTQQIIFAYGIARGMKNLHLNHIIHRDLKSENVFVSKPSFENKNIPDEFLPLFNNENEYYLPYIADLGLAKVTYDLEQSQQCGTYYYLAPEVMTSTKYSLPADVYSYAVILSNIFQLNERPEFNCKKNTNIFIKHVTEGGRPKVDGCTSSQKKFLEDLWDNNPAKRLTFVDIVEYLEKPKDDFIFNDYDKNVFEAYKKYIDYQINQNDSHSELIIKDKKILNIYKKYDKYEKNQEEYYRLDENDAKILTGFSDEKKSFESRITSPIIQNQDECIQPKEYISSFINNLQDIQSENHFLKDGILSEAKSEYEKAKEFYLNAIKSGSIQAATKLSILLLRNGDDEAKKKGFDLLQFAAEKKEKDGLFYFGYLLSEGFELKNVKADKKKAAMLLEESGRLGNSRGLFEAASIHHELAIESSTGNKNHAISQLTKALQLYKESYEKYGDQESQNLSRDLQEFLENQK